MAGANGRFLKTLRTLLLTFFLVLAAPVLAIIPGGPVETPEAAPQTQSSPAITQSQDEGEDPRIANRIRGIFAELPGFAGVTVEVSEGVVRLSGTVPDAAAIDRAEAIAARVSGVVTVENALERDLSVEQNLSILGQVSEIADSTVAALPLIAVAIFTAMAIGVLGYLIAGAGFVWNRLAPNAFLSELVRSAIRFIFIVGGVVVALDMIGAGALLGAVLGGAGVIGIALGFAMRDTIENYVASVMLSLRQPFRPNDHVVIDDLEGRVIRLTSRATILMTLEGNHVRIPNAQVFKAVILNYTRNPQRRFDFELGIDADDDPRAAMALGGATLAALPFILDDPEPAARIKAVGDSNIVILFLGWIDQREADWFKSRSIAIAAVKEALEDAGFALPEPIYRLRFDPRTGALPIGSSTADSKPAPPLPAGGKAHGVPATDADVRPESEISELVAAERQSSKEQDKDLLDENRPVE